jgi:hypothetical protein
MLVLMLACRTTPVDLGQDTGREAFGTLDGAEETHTEGVGADRLFLGHEMPVCPSVDEDEGDMLCILQEYGGSTIFELYSGEVREQIELPYVALYSASLSVRDRMVMSCAYDEGVWVFDLDAQTMSRHDVACDDITHVTGGYRISVYSEWKFVPEAELSAWLSGAYTPVAGGALATTSRHAMGDDGVVYGAWHSIDAVESVNGTIPLEDYDTWVWGMDVVDERLLLLDDGRWDGSVDHDAYIHVFDLQGNRLRMVNMGRRTSSAGMACDCYDGE